MKGVLKFMKTFWFTSEDGEDFFVEEKTVDAAVDTAIAYFSENVKYHGIVSTEWAEMQGWDTY